MTPQSFIRAGQFVVGVGIARLLSALLLLPRALKSRGGGYGWAQTWHEGMRYTPPIF
jgi:hypothetical protein